ncbi:MAG: PH domain-containing protein [Dehalococcoidia bacterium]|uniref:PH domain-containing protein n=1 Tax=Candidatus Amarobacter glycogenicus TaxID=3140699 RepID=UPI002A0F17C4|nr:PH domain-containing protein [Dehalococcoidia bacterium]MBK7125679.1 PH domain-containing protein [Dehalococcoidia bacterium]MBK9613194.1 PH domain-containing protein [Dehalococcoidia bacterium]
MTEQPDIPPPSPAGRPTLKLPFELQSDEVVLLFARRHWLFFYGYLAVVILSGIVGTIGLVLLVLSTVGFDGLAGKGIAAALIAWAGYWGVRGYFHWYRYQNDIWAVTNQRLVDSIRRHWFHHEMASADLVDVQDMRVVREGILHTMLNFGDVRCQTAGEVPNFVLDGIPDPKRVLAVVDAARDAARRALRDPI